MSAPHALPMLADNLTGLLPPCQATQLTPRAQPPRELVLPGAWGPADSGTPAPPHLPCTHGSEGFVLLVACLQPGTVLDRLALREGRGQACAHGYGAQRPLCKRNKQLFW